jgi:hypothetical protein
VQDRAGAGAGRGERREPLRLRQPAARRIRVLLGQPPLARIVWHPESVGFLFLRADPVGLYFGTTHGEVWASADEGASWSNVARHLPQVHAGQVAELA